MSRSHDDGSQTIPPLRTHGTSGEAGSGPASTEGVTSSSVHDERRALTEKLMERVCEPSNLNRAFKRVVSNKGAPGIDGMTVETLRTWIATNKEAFVASLQDGSYMPQPVRAVEIPKPSGGTRELGIPTVVDRLVQQAILQVLQPIFEPMFSSSSFGFRPGKSAHGAIEQASRYVEEGKRFVVDMDLEKFFDRVNHDILMSRLARTIGDKRLLRIIRRFLQAGLMRGGVVSSREEGTPQGGPLSPLLSNVLLDDLDKELESRGHSFCRYADDCNVYVASSAAASRVLSSITAWLSKTLRLKVNVTKSAAAPVEERKFLGYRLLADGRPIVAPESLARLQKKIRDATKRRTPRPVERLAADLAPLLREWGNYFRLAYSRSVYRHLDSWIRRRLRAVRLQQCKRVFTLKTYLVGRGVPEHSAWALALSGKGKWHLARTPQAHTALPTKWFSSVGLISLEQQHLSFKL